MPLSNKQIALAFLFFTILDIKGIVTHFPLLQYIAKPLLLPLLMLLLVFSTPPNAAGKIIMLTALLFSWWGDIFLMIESANPLFFILGLACFLTTHILYIIYFLKIRSAAISLLKKQPLLVLLVVGYGIAMVFILFPHLGSLKIPVIVYALTICTMLLSSLHIFYKTNKPANYFFAAGAAIFVLSDSLLAFNKFYSPFAFAGVGVMLTYCTAQYCMVTGYIKQHSHD